MPYDAETIELLKALPLRWGVPWTTLSSITPGVVFEKTKRPTGTEGERKFGAVDFGDVTAAENVARIHNELLEEEKSKINCRACAHSYMEPDGPLTCGLPELGPFGKKIDEGGGQHCDIGKKFEQHPQRTPTGDLK